MLRFVPYILKTLWRHRARTLLTVSGAAVALFVFCFVQAVGDGVRNLNAQGEADRTLIVFQANRFCPFTSELPEDYAPQIAKIAGVEKVIPIKVYTNNCRASLDVVVFHGMPPEQLREARAFELSAGSWEPFQKVSDAALVGQNVARRRGLSPGMPFTLGGVTVQVKGVFKSAQPSDDDFVYTHLDFLQRMRGRETVGKVTQFEVRLATNVDSPTVCEAIDDLFRGGPVLTDTRTKGVFQADTVADLAEMIGFAHWLGYACVGLVLALVATTTVMAVQDRISEHALLQTLGFTSLGIFSLVVVESLLLACLGGAIGVVAANLALASHGVSLGTEAVTISFEPSLRLILSGAAVTIAVGILAGIVPGIQAARAQIVPSLRAA